MIKALKVLGWLGIGCTLVVLAMLMTAHTNSASNSAFLAAIRDVVNNQVDTPSRGREFRLRFHVCYW